MGKVRETRRWLWRGIIASTLMPLLLVELALVGAYLLTHRIMHEEHTDWLQVEASQLLGQAAEREARLMESHLADWERQVAMLADEAQHALQTSVDVYQLGEVMRRHRLTPEGAFYAYRDDGDAASFYSSRTPVPLQDYRKVAQLATLDPFFKLLTHSDPRIRQAYVNTYDSYNRLWPWVNSRKVFADDIDIPSFNFYYLADERHNPERQPVWTDVYLDPAGGGWMVSAIAPIYRSSFLEGVAGLDITLNQLINHLLSVQLPWSGYAVLLGRDGTLLAMPPAAEHDFGIDELTDADYGDAIRQDNFKPRHFNLQRLSDDPALNDVLMEKQGAMQSHLAGEPRLLAWQEMPGVGWTLLTVVDEASAFAASRSMADFFRGLGYLMVAGLAVFYLMVTAIAWSRSRALARTLIDSLAKLREMAIDIAMRRVVQPHAFPLREFEAAGDALIGVAHERNQALAELAAEKERLRLAMDASGGAVWEYDVVANRLTMHENVFRMLGVETVTSVPLEYFRALIHPDDQQRFEVQRRRVLLGKIAVGEAELRLRHAQGQWLWVLSRGSVLERNEKGRALRAIGVVLDIQPQKRVTAELERARDDAERSQQAQSRLFSRVSHELRTPLNAILGFADLLQSEDKSRLNEQERSYLIEIARAADRLDGLLGDVLQLASVESGELKFECEPQAALRCLHRNAGQLMSHAARAGVQLSVLDQAGAWLMADRRRLDQVLQNLIENAIKYNRRGGWVRLASWADESHVCLEVADNGFGIAEERRGELFSPFSRLGMEHSDIQGTGLGLALSQELVRRMQGRIEVVSHPGEGSHFQVWLPRVNVQTHQAEVIRALPTRAKLDRALMLLLVCADQRTRVRLEVLADHLGNLELLSAHRHAQAMRMITEHRPDLLVCCNDIGTLQASELLNHAQRCTRNTVKGIWIGSSSAPAGFMQAWQRPPCVDEVWNVLQHANRSDGP